LKSNQNLSIDFYYPSYAKVFAEQKLLRSSHYPLPIKITQYRKIRQKGSFAERQINNLGSITAIFCAIANFQFLEPPAKLSSYSPFLMNHSPFPIPNSPLTLG
jgi:hypothetical protein